MKCFQNKFFFSLHFGENVFFFVFLSSNQTHIYKSFFFNSYGDTGNSLVTSAIDKLIFVGSPGVGVHVMRAAAENLTPVVLELGGKDPFVVCEDANIDSIVQTACRGVWQNMGQNCAGPERFFVYESVFQEFCDKVTKVVSNMSQGPPLHGNTVDCGAICMGIRQMKHYQKLVDDAVKKGAKVFFCLWIFLLYPLFLLKYKHNCYFICGDLSLFVYMSVYRCSLVVSFPKLVINSLKEVSIHQLF